MLHWGLLYSIDWLVLQCYRLLHYFPPSTAVDCMALPNPTNGQVMAPSGTTFNNTATYSCDGGYELNGPMTRMCGIDSSWTLTEPTCECKFVIDKFDMWVF